MVCSFVFLMKLRFKLKTYRLEALFRYNMNSKNHLSLTSVKVLYENRYCDQEDLAFWHVEDFHTKKTKK